MPVQETYNSVIPKKVNNVSCRNINVIALYVEAKLGNSTLLLSDLPYSREYLLNEHNWIPLATYNEIMKRAISLLRDPQAPYKMGLSAMELESWGLFKYIRNIFLTLVIDPNIVYRKVSEYNPLFNVTKDFTFLSSSKTHCVFTVRFKDNVNPVDDFYSDSYIRGILASIPNIWNLPSSSIEVVTHEYDLLDLLHRVGGVPRHDMELVDGVLTVSGEEIARQVNEDTHSSWWKPFAKTTFSIHDESLFSLLSESFKKGTTAFAITKTCTVSPMLTLREGELYNAPHFTYHITWNTPPVSVHVKHLLFQRWRSHTTYENAIVDSLATMKDYTETLEQKVLERTKELDDARKESEYWRTKTDELLATMLPEHIAKTMVEKSLESQEVHGTVLYTDIVGFTEYSRTHSQNDVDRELKVYFAEITNIVTRHGGWVNKFLGDGMLVVFGLHGNQNATVDATKAAKQLVENVEKYSWGTRVSVTTGPFTIGEYGNGALRRFDCVGHTLNLGSRLQSHAGINEIIVCDNTYNSLIKENTSHTFGKKQTLSIKGIGEVEAYALH